MILERIPLQYYGLTALVNAVVATVCSAVVYFHNPRSRKNISYALHCLLVALWSWFYFAWQLSTTHDTALLFLRITILFAGWLPAAHLYYTLELLDLKTPLRVALLKLSCALALIQTALSFTTLFVADVEQRLIFPFWGVPGPLYIINQVAFIFPIAVALYAAWEFRTKASPFVRNKLAWLIFATAFGYGGGGTNWPLWFNIPLPPFLNPTVTIYLIVASFLFFQLGIFDINLILKETFIRLITALALGGTFALLTYPFIHSIAAAITILLISILIPLIYRPVYLRIKYVLNRIFFRESTEYLTTMGATMEKIKETTYTYDDLANNIVKSLKNTFPIDMAAVYFYDLANKEFRLRAQEGMTNPLARDLRFNRSSLSIPEADPLVQFCEGKNDVVVKEILETELGDEAPLPVIASLQKREAAVCAPFLFGGKLKGFLMLGKKRKDRMFNQGDLDAVYSFGRMGEEVMRYIMGMETELQNTSLYSHDMDNDIRAILQTIEVLQSPMAKNLPEDRQQKLLGQAKEVAGRLSHSFQSNRERSSLIMRAIRGEYERKPVDLGVLVRASCDKNSLFAEKRHVRLDVDLPQEMGMVEGQSDDLIRIFDNLLGNALRYVGENGHVQVTGEDIGSQFRITVKDNGQGIEPEDLAKIWDMGYQSKSRPKGAAGFGLSIVRQIVALHRGAIRVESAGLGQGTAFIVEIPKIGTINPPPHV